MPEEAELRALPKGLVPVGGKPIIGYLMEQLGEVDVTIVTNSAHYSRFDAWLRSSGYRARLLDNGTASNETRLGGVMDLKLGLGDRNGDVFVAASDVVLPHFSFSYLVSQFAAGGDCIVGSRMDPERIRRRNGNLVADGSGRIVRFVEKPEVPISDVVSVPYYILREKTVDLLQRYLREGNPTDPIGRFVGWLTEQATVRCAMVPEPYFDVGVYTDWKAADAWLRRLDER